MSSRPPSTLSLTQRVRRATPKVRTGCKTCKIRHVKCGEEKPYCNRCTSTGRQCEYAQTTSHGQFSVLTLPQMLHCHIGASSSQIKTENVRYLEYYHKCTSQGISTEFDAAFWSRMTLQMAQSEPCVRYALIALGYLTMNTTGSLKDACAKFGATSAPKTLLFHYNKSVDTLLKRMSETSYVPEIGLVSCMLFICIEFLRGNHVTALIHFTSGLKILSATRESQLSLEKSPNKPMIDRTLAAMFTRMMAMPLLYGIPTELVIEDSPEHIPSNFASMFEIQDSMHNICNMSMLFIHDIWQKRGQGLPLVEEDWQRGDRVLQYLKAWWDTVDNFQKQTILSKESTNTIHSLKATYYCTYIFAACILRENQMAFDKYLDSFKALIAHAKAFLDTCEEKFTDRPIAKFTFETGVIPQLAFVASYCRCPITRREAISLLERNPPREGLCDAGPTVLVAKRVIQLEESEVDSSTGWPVERTRIWVSTVHGDMDKNGKFSASFSIGVWGQGRDMPLLAPGAMLTKEANNRIWREWFVLEE